MRSSTRQNTRSPFAKSVACLSIFLTLSVAWWPLVASASSLSGAAARRSAAGASTDLRGTANRVVDRLTPLSISWRPEGGPGQSGSRGSGAILFDGDEATVLRTEGPAVLRVTLPAAHSVRGLGVFGRADGRISVFLPAAPGGAGVSGASGEPGQPIEGLQDLDLSTLPLRWNRFWSRQAPPADEVILVWRPNHPGAILKELELFGLGPDVAADSGSTLADHLIAGSPPGAVEAWSDIDGASVSSPDLGLDGVASFPVHLSLDPRLIDRAFLVYELAGFERWSAPRRQVNGFGVVGGYKADRVEGTGGVQVEEISPEWLFHGDNEIHFLPTDEHDPAGYGVRHLRIVAFPGAKRSAALPVDADRQSVVLAALSDGDPSTGVGAAREPAVVTWPLPAAAQPSGLNLRVGAPMTGHLQITTVSAQGKVSRAQEIDARTLAPGWSFVGLDGLPRGAAVRLTWDAGREGSGSLSEVRLVNSPDPEGRGRKLVVSAPLHGECVDHEVYLRGFVTGTASEAKRPDLWIGDQRLPGGVGADGAFAFGVAEPASARGSSWTVALRARFGDTTEVARTIPIAPCGDRPAVARAAQPPGPRALVEDTGAPFEKTVLGGHADVVDMGGVRLEIPEGALAETTRITVRPLIDDQLAPLDPLMENVTPERQGFRLGPHNLQFKKPVRISVPYDRVLVSDGIGANEMGVFFFDDQEGRWQRLQATAAGARSGRTLIAETTHFTDFIAATLAVPEHPSPMSNNSKMFADLKAGDPAAGIRIMAPPTPGPDGAARMTFPIDIPPGRNGMQPNVDLQYDSNSPDGLMGVGWTFPLPNIQVDTKFGSPRLETIWESDHYLLNGEELVKLGSCGVPSFGRCFDPTPFRRRAEHGAFERIIRLSAFGLENSTTGAPGWAVTNQDGTTWEYGNTNWAIGDQQDWIDYGEGGVPVYWALANIHDRFGNRVEYHYQHYNPVGPDEAMSLRTITYTKSPTMEASFTVEPEYSPRAPTYSALSDGHLSREIQTKDLLVGLRVRRGTHTFRHYVFSYMPGEFGKPLLQTITVKSGDNETSFYTYKFDYNKLPRETTGAQRVQFGGPTQWNASPLSTGATLGAGNRTAASLNGFIGLGPVTCYPHVGVGMSGGGDVDKTKDAFLDVNGDGLPDLLSGGNTVYLNGFDKTGGTANRNKGTFSTLTTAYPDLGHSSSSSLTMSLGLHFPGELGANVSYTGSHAVEDLTIADMNGDGLPDVFNGTAFWCNQFPGTTCPANAGRPFSTTPTPWGGQTNLAVYDDGAPGSRGGTTFQSKMMARWTAPLTGTVNLVAPATRVTTVLPPPAVNQPYADDAILQLYMRSKLGGTIQDTLLWNYTFAATDTRTCYTVPGSSCSPNLNVNFNVTAGDEFFFMVSAPEKQGQAGNIRNAIRWNPHFKYINLPCADPNDVRTCVASYKDHLGAPIYEYDLNTDLRIAGGMAPTWTTASADTRANGQRVATTMVRITGTITKSQATPDDVKFQVVKLTPSGGRVVVWTQGMTTTQTGSISLDALNVMTDVQGKWVLRDDGSGHAGWSVDADQLVFQVVTDTPIDPGTIQWSPVVTYQNFCAPDAADQQARYLVSHVMPSPDVVKINCTNTPSTVIGSGVSQAIDVQFPSFRYGPESPDTAATTPLPDPESPTYYFSGTGQHTIRVAANLSVAPTAFGLDPQNPDLGQVVLMFHAGSRLLKKQVFPLGTNHGGFIAGINTGAMSLSATEPFYASIYSYGNHRVNFALGQVFLDGSATSTAGIIPTLHTVMEPPLPGKAAGAPYSGPLADQMVGGYRQWTYGVFNNDFAFSTSQIQLSAGSSVNSFFPAVATRKGLGVTPTDPTLPGSGASIWRGRGGDDYIAPGVFHPGYTGSGAAGAGAPPGIGLRRTLSQTTGGGANAGVSLETNYGGSTTEYDLIDVTGDGVPDMVGLNSILASNNFVDNTFGWGPNSNIYNALPFAQVRGASNLNVRFGIGLGSYASQMSSKSDASGSSNSLKSSAPSFGFGYGTSSTGVDMMDINGDGFVDYVQRSGTNLNVRLGQGRSTIFFGPYQPWYKTWPMPSLSGNIVQSTQFTIGNALLGDGLRAQDTASNSLEMNIMGMGGGVSYTTTRTMVDMMDMNGDGLPDRVMKLAGADEIQIQFNQGTSFGTPERWAVPAWGSTVGIESKGFAGLNLGSNDVLAFSQTQNTSLNVGVFIPIPIVFVCLVAELSAAADTAVTNTQMTLQDINGDGLPDQVFKKNDLSDPTSTGTSTTIWTKLNPAGMANRLKTVSGPLGGFYDIEYARAGNEVDPATHTDDPTNHWVMSAATVRRGSTSTGLPAWNAEPSQRTEYTFANGFYSRADRIFLGFANVTTKHVGTGDQIVEQDTYDTSDVYHKGLRLKHVVRKRPSTDTTTADNALPVFEVEQDAYEVRPLQSVINALMDNRPVFFVPRIRKFFRSYEGGSTNPDAATLTRELDYDYENTYGAVISYFDLGDTSTTADDVKYTISPFQDATNYVIKPGAITAKDTAGTVLATRAPSYYNTGKIASITDVIKGGRNPADGSAYTATNATWNFHYDAFGNLLDYQDPVGYKVTVTSVDPDVATYPKTFQDSFGYTWSETHNLMTGALASTTDVNGNSVGYLFDVHERLSQALSAWNGTTGTLKMAVSYAEATDPLVQSSLPARVLVQYQNPELSATVSYADGWGRVFQTKAKAEVDSTGTGTAASGVIVSGKSTYDAYGRLASQGMPQFVSGAIVDLLQGLSNFTSKNPTSFTYDVLNRKTKITYPGTRPAATNAYNLVSVGGVLRRQVVATDSNAQVKRSYSDPRNNTVLVETPNTIGGVLKNLQTTYAFDPLDRLHIVTDAKNNKTTINWDSAGRMVDLTNADTGKTFYDRDLNGNVGRKQNAKGDLVVYHRTNSRLDSVTYPTTPTVTYTYGAPGAGNGRAGRIATRTDEGGSETFNYDFYGNVSLSQFTPAVPTGSPAPPTYQTTYAYDTTLGTLRTVTVGGTNEVTTYTYNSQGLPSSVIGWNNGTGTIYAGKIDYDEFGKRTRLELGNGVTTTYAYDANTRRLTNLNAGTNSGTPIQKLAYQFDQVGHVTKMDNTVGAPPFTTPASTVAPGPTSFTFTYDNLYQLKGATGTYTGVGAFGGRNYTLTMAYDEIGNITSKVQADTLRAVPNGTPVTQTLTSYTFNYTYAGTHPHGATTVGSTQSGNQTGMYDADGNRLSMKNGTAGRDLTWNAEDRMASVKLNGATATSFLYRADGTRAVKRVGTTATSDTYYVSPHLVDRRGVGTTHNIMLGDERLVSIVNTPSGGFGGMFFYHPDHLQSSNYVTNSNGILIQHDEYFPFGETWIEQVLNGSSSNRTPYLFSAKEQDEGGLYYFGGRYLDPRVSTWMNPDPALVGYAHGTGNGGLSTPENLDLYSYAYNSPLSLRDPNGLTPKDPAAKPAATPAATPSATPNATTPTHPEWLQRKSDVAAKGKDDSGAPVAAVSGRSGSNYNPRKGIPSPGQGNDRQGVTDLEKGGQADKAEDLLDRHGGDGQAAADEIMRDAAKAAEAATKAAEKPSLWERVSGAMGRAAKGVKGFFDGASSIPLDLAPLRLLMEQQNIMMGRAPDDDGTS